MPSFHNFGDIVLLNSKGRQLQIHIKNRIDLFLNMCCDRFCKAFCVHSSVNCQMEKFFTELLFEHPENGLNRGINHLSDFFTSLHVCDDAIQREMWDPRYPVICLLFLLLHRGSIWTYHFANYD